MTPETTTPQKNPTKRILGWAAAIFCVGAAASLIDKNAENRGRALQLQTTVAAHNAFIKKLENDNNTVYAEASAIEAQVEKALTKMFGTGLKASVDLETSFEYYPHPAKGVDSGFGNSVRVDAAFLPKDLITVKVLAEDFSLPLFSRHDLSVDNWTPVGSIMLASDRFATDGKGYMISDHPLDTPDRVIGGWLAQGSPFSKELNKEPNKFAEPRFLESVRKFATWIKEKGWETGPAKGAVGRRSLSIHPSSNPSKLFGMTPQ
jgi:hypothetical protein